MSEIRCPEVDVRNSDSLNMTAFYTETHMVTCDDDHFAFGDENETSYLTQCHLNKTFSPLVNCEREFSITQFILAAYLSTIKFEQSVVSVTLCFARTAVLFAVGGAQ